MSLIHVVVLRVIAYESLIMMSGSIINFLCEQTELAGHLQRIECGENLELEIGLLLNSRWELYYLSFVRILLNNW